MLPGPVAPAVHVRPATTPRHVTAFQVSGEGSYPPPAFRNLLARTLPRPSPAAAHSARRPARGANGLSRALFRRGPAHTSPRSVPR